MGPEIVRLLRSHQWNHIFLSWTNLDLVSITSKIFFLVIRCYEQSPLTEIIYSFFIYYCYHRNYYLCNTSSLLISMIWNAYKWAWNWNWIKGIILLVQEGVSLIFQQMIRFSSLIILTFHKITETTTRR